MKQICKTFSLKGHSYIQQYFSKTDALFDIETTGFSAKNSFIYLIGMALLCEDTLEIYQFLAENRNEEKDIITAFHQKLTSVNTLISFNGLGFDIPFLKAKENTYSINSSLDSYQQIDLHKLTARLAGLLNLPDKKQKTVEHFLGIQRKDRFSGGELISLYYEYEKQQNSKIEDILLLHNFEDILGMAELLSLLSYRDFFEQPIRVLTATVMSHRPCGTDYDVEELLLELAVQTPFPKKVLYHSEYAAFMCQDYSAKLLIPIENSSVKFYYDNYKDYYYLPDEDMAIHKSVASFVDKEHRIKATPMTCYKKIAITDEFLKDTASLSSYAAQISKRLIEKRR